MCDSGLGGLLQTNIFGMAFVFNRHHLFFYLGHVIDCSSGHHLFFYLAHVIDCSSGCFLFNFFTVVGLSESEGHGTPNV